VTDPAAAPSRPVRTVTVAAVLFLLLLLGLAGARSWRDLDRARGREAELEAKVEATEERIEALERRIRRLREDPLMLERLAREELGLVEEGDVVIVVGEE
jgi:cell division protein FtsB